MTTNVTPELVEVRKQADALGVKYHHLANADTIRKKIAEAGAEVPTPSPVNKTGNGPKFGRGAVLTAEEFKKAEVGKRIRNAGALRRVQITCMDPTKKNWDGEVISVGSSKAGTYKKFVPYNGLPYHVPQIIYDELKTRECTVFINEKRGAETFKKGKLIKKYAITDLPPLTSEELEDLAKKQALAQTGL